MDWSSVVSSDWATLGTLSQRLSHLRDFTRAGTFASTRASGLCECQPPSTAAIDPDNKKTAISASERENRVLRWIYCLWPSQCFLWLGRTQYSSASTQWRKLSSQAEWSVVCGCSDRRRISPAIWAGKNWGCVPLSGSTVSRLPRIGHSPSYVSSLTTILHTNKRCSLS